MTEQKVFCKYCKKEKPLPFIPAEVAYLLAGNRCFDCDFWYKLSVMADDPGMVRVGGEHYHIGSEYEKENNRGFGGRKFVIKFFCGKTVTTENLNYNGVVPEEWKKLSPDNAEFWDGKTAGSIV